MKGPAPTEIPGLNGVWLYRGVRFEQRGGEWCTHSQIVQSVNIHGRGDIRTTGRITARSQPQLLKKIDAHIDNGGEIET